MPDTLGYYDDNAEAFVESTFEVAMDKVLGELHQNGR